MRFHNAVIRLDGQILADHLSGALLSDPDPPGPHWGGQLDFPDGDEGLQLFLKIGSVSVVNIEIPGVLKGEVMIRNASGKFVGSGSPLLYQREDGCNDY
jgi:hypothetical protein